MLDLKIEALGPLKANRASPPGGAGQGGQAGGSSFELQTYLDCALTAHESGLLCYRTADSRTHVVLLQEIMPLVAAAVAVCCATRSKVAGENLKAMVRPGGLYLLAAMVTSFLSNNSLG